MPVGLTAPGGQGLGLSGAAQTNRCCWPSHEKQTAIKPTASRDREFYINESQWGIKSPRHHLDAKHLSSCAAAAVAALRRRDSAARARTGTLTAIQNRGADSDSPAECTRSQVRAEGPGWRPGSLPVPAESQWLGPWLGGNVTESDGRIDCLTRNSSSSSTWTEFPRRRLSRRLRLELELEMSVRLGRRSLPVSQAQLTQSPQSPCHCRSDSDFRLPLQPAWGWQRDSGSRAWHWQPVGHGHGGIAAAARRLDHSGWPPRCAPQPGCHWPIMMSLHFEHRLSVTRESLLPYVTFKSSHCGPPGVGSVARQLHSAIVGACVPALLALAVTTQLC